MMRIRTCLSILVILPSVWCQGPDQCSRHPRDIDITQGAQAVQGGSCCSAALDQGRAIWGKRRGPIRTGCGSSPETNDPNAETIIAEVTVISEQKREGEPLVKKPRHPAEVAKANQNLQVRGDVLRVCRGHNVLMLFSDSQRQETSSSTPWRGEKGKSEQS